VESPEVNLLLEVKLLEVGSSELESELKSELESELQCLEGKLSGFKSSDIESSVESSLMVAGWRSDVSGGAVKSPDGTQANLAS